jgi:hypothetical protein
VIGVSQVNVEQPHSKHTRPARGLPRLRNPILIIGNKYDPRTQYANSVQAPRRLGNAVLLTLQGYGHTSEADPSTCLDNAVTQYLVTTTTPPVEPSANRTALRSTLTSASRVSGGQPID